jgi:hypothetical protein
MKLLINKLFLATILMLTVAVTILPACSKNSTVTVTASPAKIQPTETNPIVVDPVNREVRIAARVNGVAFTQPTWHTVVYTGGKATGAALFQAFVSPDIFYPTLTYFGGVPGNNMPQPPAVYAGTYVQGSNISLSVTWEGAPKTYNLIEVVKDPGTKGLQMKFGGNAAANAAAGTGCITCFYSCPFGLTSNSTYNGEDNAAQAKAGQGGFLGNSTVLPKDGTIVVLTYKITA